MLGGFYCWFGIGWFGFVVWYVVVGCVGLW